MLANTKPGACVRGGGRAVYGDGAPILVSPDSLRPGVDVVRLIDAAHGLPSGTWGLYLGHNGGSAIVAFPGLPHEVAVDPSAIDEPEFLPCDSVDPYEFMSGWAYGRHACAREMLVGEHAVGNVPEAYGRGVARGYDDQLAGRKYKLGSYAPYNDHVRLLAERYPGEHYAPASRRLRTLFAAVAA